MPRPTTYRRRTLAEIERLQGLLAVHLEAGFEVKAFAAVHDVTVQWAYHTARDLGYSAMYVSPAERTDLMARRKNQRAWRASHRPAA